MSRLVEAPEKIQLYGQLIKAAREAMAFAYCPISDFAVGAAALADDGSIYTGCNIENANLGGGICAERTAFAKAISEGRQRFSVVAIVSRKANNCWPCGLCRQFMREFGGDTIIVVEGRDGNFHTQLLDELLPLPVQTCG